MPVHLNQSLQFEAICHTQVRAITLDQCKKGLMPHDRHVGAIGSNTCPSHIVFAFIVHLVHFVVGKLDEKICDCVDDLRWQGILLRQEGLKEETAADLVLHVCQLHDGGRCVQIVDRALGQDAAHDDGLSCGGILGKRQ